MRLLYLFLWVLIVGYNACKARYQPPPSPANSPDFKKAASFLDHQNDSAFYYFNKVATSSKDSLLIARAYSNMAAIESDAGDLFGSQESLLTSLKYLNEREPKNHWCFAADYNELGRTSSDLKNYEAAIKYYDLAFKYSSWEDFKTVILNNKAVTFRQMRHYADAIAIYQKIIDQSKANKKEYARVLSNLANVKWLQDSSYAAAPELLSALRIRQDLKDDWGLNASYAHLSDYYAHSRPDSSLFYANRMYATALKINSPDDQLEALQKLITLSPPNKVKPYFQQYQFLSDSLQTSRNAAKNQFALIRYEAQKSKADNLRLQKDIAEERVQNLQQRTISVSILIFCIAFFLAFFSWHKRRKQQIEWNAKNTIRENLLRTSQKVHDVVAGGLYQIMTEIEYQERMDKEEILDKMEILYDQSRDISYDQPTAPYADFQKVISNLLTSFASQDIKVSVVGNDTDLWRYVKDHVKGELEHILREVMINMKKHSSASNVVVKFQRQRDNLQIQYTDDGVGLPSPIRYGNGLTNTENRIHGIGGRISFDNNATKGVRIQLSLFIT